MVYTQKMMNKMKGDGTTDKKYKSDDGQTNMNPATFK
jgi:hypothetical protein